MLISEGEILRSMLTKVEQFAGSTALPSLLIVKSEACYLGSISLECLFQPPALIYLLCLSLELEAATVDLLSMFPRSLHVLSKQRKKNIAETYQFRKEMRLNELLDSASGDWSLLNCEISRELLQTTMMCDKRDILKKASLGLKTSKGKLDRVFQFCEKIRNYVVHPTAEFTRNADAALFLACQDHESIEDSESSILPLSRKVSDELKICSMAEIAKGVRECFEVIDDLDGSIRKAT